MAKALRCWAVIKHLLGIGLKHLDLVKTFFYNLKVAVSILQVIEKDSSLGISTQQHLYHLEASVEVSDEIGQFEAFPERQPSVFGDCLKS